MLPSTRKGICRLSVVPVRNEGKEQSEMVTQLLFGDFYEVIAQSENGNWLQIKIAYDGYTGWIDKNQFTSITDEFFDQLANSDRQISTDLVSKLSHDGMTSNLVIGSTLPFTGNELFQIGENLLFEGNSKAQSEKLSIDYVEKYATLYLNAPYMWGGKSPFGIDCSGFTQMVFKLCGYRLLRDAGLQADQGDLVHHIDEAKAGDLAFFAKNDNKVYHVGIIMKENMIIHSSGFVRIDKLDDTGIFNKSLNRYTHNLFSIRRILKQ